MHSDHRLRLFLERLRVIYPDDLAKRIETTLTSPRNQGYWCNALVANGEQVPLPGCEVKGFAGRLRVVGPGDRDSLTRHPATTAGVWYPMDPSSVVAAQSLDAAPGEEILDLAAAPGGKTVVIANAMSNRGRIAAVEPGRRRFHRMKANLERCGVTIAQSYLADGRSIGRKVPQRFDRVLLDAPCSSEARIRPDRPETFAHWSSRKIAESVRKQRGLMRSAYRALKPGGRLVYCTCSFAPEENEGVVAYLLRREAGASIAPLEAQQRYPDITTVAGLAHYGGREFPSAMAGAVRIIPDATFGGMFVCVIVKAA